MTTAPNCVCACCVRIFYHHSGTRPRASTVRRLEHLLRQLLPFWPPWGGAEYANDDERWADMARHLWLCDVCASAMSRRGTLHEMSVANHLALDPVPPVLADLSIMELRLVSIVHTFATIIVLPHGQTGARGQAISFRVPQVRSSAALRFAALRSTRARAHEHRYPPLTPVHASTRAPP